MKSVSLFVRPRTTYHDRAITHYSYYNAKRTGIYLQPKARSDRSIMFWLKHGLNDNALRPLSGPRTANVRPRMIQRQKQSTRAFFRRCQHAAHGRASYARVLQVLALELLPATSSSANPSSPGRFV